VPIVTTFWGSDTTVWWQRLISWFVARITFPVFVSREGALNLGLPRSPIIPSGVDLELFREHDQQQARRELGWPEDARYVLFPAARSNPLKNYELFDKAVAVARMATPDLKTVTLDGFSRTDVATAMNAVDVTMLTSDEEGSPAVVKESLACSTPVVSVPVGDVPELVRDLPGCSIQPRDPNALGDALLRALATGRHPALRRRVEPLSSCRIAEMTVGLYEQVLSRGTA
jgi:glycosyltransferase involved in cell wall biosynthesis